MITLGPLELKHPIIQSPMAGCTDLAFRMTARLHGMEMAFLEMVSSESLVRKHAKTYQLMKTLEKDKPVGCQLVGCRPEAMGESAAIVEDMGVYDLIDINIGCPVPKITGTGGGSALLKEPQTAKSIFKHMMKNLKKLPLTVKMRLGFSDSSGKEAIELAKIAEGEGLAAVSVHGRTREQGYTGQADWEAIGKVKQAVNIPVFGNGDVTSGSDAKKLIEVSGCDGVMIGRGALGNPWIYKEVQAVLENKQLPKQPSLQEKKKAFLQHFDWEVEYEGEHLGVLKARKIAGWYFKGYPGAPEFRNRVNQCRSSNEMREIISSFGVQREGDLKVYSEAFPSSS